MYQVRAVRKPEAVAGRGRSRNLLVWLHVVTSVGWMGQALALFALNVFALSAGDTATRLSALTMAEMLDEEVLLYLANAAAFTGLMLSALTPWGYFRYWWVLGKFVITISQLYAGIFVLSPNLTASAHAAATGQDRPAGVLAVGSLLMASAIAFQAWLSVAKPWRRTPWADSPGKPKRPPSGPSWMFTFSAIVPVFEYLLGRHVLGHPFPVLSLLTAIGYPVWRSRRLRRGAQDGTDALSRPGTPVPA